MSESSAAPAFLRWLILGILVLALLLFNAGDYFSDVFRKGLSLRDRALVFAFLVVGAVVVAALVVWGFVAGFPWL
jgi:hypothetical protein